MQYAVFAQDPADRPYGLQAVLARAPSRTDGLLREELFRCQSINCSSLLVKPRDRAKLRCTPLNVVWSLPLFVPWNNHVQLSLVSLQADGRVVAHLIGNIFRIDARRVAAQNYTMDVLRTDGRPHWQAFFRATGAF